MKCKNFKLLEKINEKGWNQADFTRRLEIGCESKISKIVNGRINPTSEEIKQICELLDCQKEDIGYEHK